MTHAPLAPPECRSSGSPPSNHSRRDEILRLFQEEKAVAVLENVNEIEGAL